MKYHTKNVGAILVLITLFFTLIITLLACQPSLPQASTSTTSPPERASQPTLISHSPRSTPYSQAVALHWDNSAAALIIRYYSPYTTAGLAGAYNHAYYIPEAQVWGDGRIVWVTYEGGIRRLLTGRLTTEQMTALLQRLIEADFFEWQDEYATLGGNSTPPMRLAVSLTGKAKEVEEHGGAPQAYYEFVIWLTRGAGAEGRAYIPEQGYLTAACWPDIETITPETIWPDADAGFNLGQVGQGRYIEGEILALAWQAVNQNPQAPVYVISNQQDCTIMVQIPGVSFIQPPQPIATQTPLPPTSTAPPPTFTQPPLACDTHTAEVELSASTTILQVGEVVTVSVTLHNLGCSQLGLPQYRLETTPPILNTARPEAIIHYLGLGPGQTDTAEFRLQASEADPVTLTASVSFEVHLGYPGPAYWAMSSTGTPLVITVSPPDQSGSELAPAANQLDLNGAPIRAWAWSPDGETLALAGDRSVYLYNLAAPQNPTELQVAVTDGVESVAFSPDSRLLAVSITSGALQLWNVSQQALIFALDDDPRVDYFNSLAFSPDGIWLAAGGVNSRATSSSDGIVRVIDLDTGDEAASFESYGWVGQVAFNPDGTLLGLVQSTTCGRGGSWARLVDPLTGADRELMIPGGGMNLAFSPDGTQVAVGVQTGAPCVPDGGIVQLWDLAIRQLMGTLTRFDDGPVVTFSPDGALLAASDGQTLRLWSLNPIQEVMRLLPRFGSLGSAAFSPDGRVLAYRDGETIQFKELPSDLEK